MFVILSYDNETVKGQSVTEPATGWQWLTLRRAMVAAVVALIASPALLYALPGSRSVALQVATTATFVAMAALIGPILYNVGLLLAGVDVEASAIAEHLAGDPDQQRLLARWLARARWARFVGGLSGFLICVLGTTNGDLLLLGTGGIAVGAMICELHHLRPRKGPRTATLTVRTVGDYLMRQDARRMISVGLVACAVGVAGAVSSDSRAAMWWALTALVVLAMARFAQQRVATRPRPALSSKLTRADDLARELAIGRGLARPATYFALVLVARGCYSLVPSIGDLGRTFGGAAWLYALYLWWHNRRLGLDFLLTSSGDPLISA